MAPQKQHSTQKRTSPPQKRPSSSEKKVFGGVTSLMRRPEEIIEKVIVAPKAVKFYTSLCKVKQTGNPKAPKSDCTCICHKLSKKVQIKMHSLQQMKNSEILATRLQK